MLIKCKVLFIAHHLMNVFRRYYVLTENFKNCNDLCLEATDLLFSKNSF